MKYGFSTLRPTAATSPPSVYGRQYHTRFQATINRSQHWINLKMKTRHSMAYTENRRIFNYLHSDLSCYDGTTYIAFRLTSLGRWFEPACSVSIPLHKIIKFKSIYILIITVDNDRLREFHKRRALAASAISYQEAKSWY